jgi:hypothetical protein
VNIPKYLNFVWIVQKWAEFTILPEISKKKWNFHVRLYRFIKIIICDHSGYFFLLLYHIGFLLFSTRCNVKLYSLRCFLIFNSDDSLLTPWKVCPVVEHKDIRDCNLIQNIDVSSASLGPFLIFNSNDSLLTPRKVCPVADHTEIVNKWEYNAFKTLLNIVIIYWRVYIWTLIERIFIFDTFIDNIYQLTK